MNWRKKNQSEDNTYWQTIADALAALLLVVLLIMMLLLLYIVRIQPNENVDMYEGDHYNGMTDPDPGAGNYGDDSEDNGHARYWRRGEDDDDGDGDGGGGNGGDGGGGGGEGGDSPEEGFEEGEGSMKAAVYVMVLDAETERTIKTPGIRFELYSDRDALQLLNTYYPRKTEYRHFDTTVDGVFYLPEKLLMGSYYLHELTTPRGYDTASNHAINLFEDYDWPEPYVARVMLMPSKNIVRIQMTDEATGAGIAGGSYEVIAAEDISTLDGTLRYAKGTVAAVIECDTSGCGESEEVYLGKYLLQEKQVPRFYAADLEPTEIIVEKKNGSERPGVHTLPSEKTTVVIRLSDELYGNISISGAAFSVAQDGSSRASTTVRTDEFGQIHLTDLNKNAIYRLRQVTTQEGYHMLNEDVSFLVDGNGMVEDAPTMFVELQNRMLRASISVQSSILRGLASGYNVALFDGNDELVSTWDSTAMAHRLEGLEPGDYYICVNGQRNQQKHIVIQDMKELQSYSYSVWTTADIAAASALGVFAIAAAFFGVTLLRRRMKKNTAPQEEYHE